MSHRGKGHEAEEEIQRLLLEIMEGYKDAVIPPFSYFSPNNGNNVSVSSKRQKTSEAESAISGRKRRELMTENFSLLQSMVPSLSSKNKPSREKIISDTLDYIKYLQEETKRLDGRMNFQWKEQNVEKPVLMKCINEKSSVKVGVSSGATFLAIELPFRSGLVLDIVKVLEKHLAEVLEARIDVNEQRMLTFTATVRLGSDGGSNFDKIREELLTL